MDQTYGILAPIDNKGFPQCFVVTAPKKKKTIVSRLET